MNKKIINNENYLTIRIKKWTNLFIYIILYSNVIY